MKISFVERGETILIKIFYYGLEKDYTVFCTAKDKRGESGLCQEITMSREGLYALVVLFMIVLDKCPLCGDFVKKKIIGDVKPGVIEVDGLICQGGSGTRTVEVNSIEDGTWIFEIQDNRALWRIISKDSAFGIQGGHSKKFDFSLDSSGNECYVQELKTSLSALRSYVTSLLVFAYKKCPVSGCKADIMKQLK